MSNTKIFTLDDNIGYVELIDYIGDDDRVVESARVSYLSESTTPERDARLIKYLMENKHTSPFEHVVFTFKIKCPLFVRSQWHRHRTWSYNEISRRYTSEEIEFYTPKVFRKQSESNKQVGDEIIEDNLVKNLAKLWIENINDLSLATYNSMLKFEVCREQARMVLPQNLYTTFYGTVDLHNLFHFLELRNSEHAQYEIRVYAEAIEKLIEPIVPVSYNAWKGTSNGNK